MNNQQSLMFGYLAVSKYIYIYIYIYKAYGKKYVFNYVIW